jgi:hypothetical protein
MNWSKAPLKEDVEVDPRLMYPLSKKMMEDVIETYKVNYGLDIVTLRFFNVFGPRQDIHRKSPPLINYITRCFDDGIEATFYSDGTQQRDYVHVDDVVEMISLCMVVPEAAGEIFNVCTGTTTSVKDIISYAEKAYGPFSYKFLPRTDFFGDYIPTVFPKIQAIPYREYFKHFDGYTHIHKHDINLQSRAANISCPLYIPFGFFENNIKLRIGYENVITDCININLNKNNYTVVDNNGTDLKCFQNEIPYFWKKRISETYINPKYNENNFISLRDNSIIYPLTCGYFHNSFNNVEILNKIKETYNIK